MSILNYHIYKNLHAFNTNVTKRQLKRLHVNYIKIFLSSYFLLYTRYQVVHAINEIMFNSKSLMYKMKSISCDSLKPRGPLTNRQPLENLWMSGNPIPHCCVPFTGTHNLTKIT